MVERQCDDGPPEGPGCASAAPTTAQTFVMKCLVSHVDQTRRDRCCRWRVGGAYGAWFCRDAELRHSVIVVVVSFDLEGAVTEGVRDEAGSDGGRPTRAGAPIC